MHVNLIVVCTFRFKAAENMKTIVLDLMVKIQHVGS